MGHYPSDLNQGRTGGRVWPVLNSLRPLAHGRRRLPPVGPENRIGAQEPRFLAFPQPSAFDDPSNATTFVALHVHIKVEVLGADDGLGRGDRRFSSGATS